jgi:hypothetical protein
MPIAPLNRIFRNHGHLYAYDAEAMISALTGAGFYASREDKLYERSRPEVAGRFRRTRRRVTLCGRNHLAFLLAVMVQSKREVLRPLPALWNDPLFP